MVWDWKATLISPTKPLWFFASRAPNLPVLVRGTDKTFQSPHFFQRAYVGRLLVFKFEFLTSALVLAFVLNFPVVPTHSPPRILPNIYIAAYLQKKGLRITITLSLSPLSLASPADVVIKLANQAVPRKAFVKPWLYRYRVCHFIRVSLPAPNFHSLFLLFSLHRRFSGYSEKSLCKMVLVLSRANTPSFPYMAKALIQFRTKFQYSFSHLAGA